MDFDNSLDIITPDLQSSITIGGTGGLIVPVGSTVNRPAATDGMIRFNSDFGTLEYVTGGTYVQVPTSAGAALDVGSLFAFAAAYG